MESPSQEKLSHWTSSALSSSAPQTFVCHTSLSPSLPDLLHSVAIMTDTLLLILGALQVFLAQVIRVSQTPQMSVAAGSSVTLPCHYSISGQEGEGNATLGAYRWFRHHVSSRNDLDNDPHFSTRISRTPTDQFIRERLAAITLHHVVMSDSGLYYCDVIFYLASSISGQGNGTYLIVTDPEGPVSSVWQICGGVASGLLLVALVGLVYRVSSSQAAAAETQRDRAPTTPSHSQLHDLSDREYQMLEDLPQLDTSQYSIMNLHYSPLQEPRSSCEQGAELYSFIP